MKIFWHQNPCCSSIILSDDEKKIMQLRMLIDSFEDTIISAQYYFDEDPKRAKNELNHENVPKLVQHEYQWMIKALGEIHCGDCTCVPSSCAKCMAERAIGFSTIKGCTKYSLYRINCCFINKDFKQKENFTIDDAIKSLYEYEPKFEKSNWSNEEEFNKYVPRWKTEAEEAMKWLIKYRDEKFCKGVEEIPISLEIDDYSDDLDINPKDNNDEY